MIERRGVVKYNRMEAALAFSSSLSPSLWVYLQHASFIFFLSLHFGNHYFPVARMQKQKKVVSDEAGRGRMMS